MVLAHIEDIGPDSVTTDQSDGDENVFIRVSGVWHIKAYNLVTNELSANTLGLPDPSVTALVVLVKKMMMITILAGTTW